MHLGYLAWKTEAIGVAATSNPASTTTPAASAILIQTLKKNDDPHIHKARSGLALLSEWSSAYASGSELALEFPPQRALEDARSGLQSWASIKRDSLSYDHDHFLPWLMSAFDRRTASATLTQLMFGGILRLREAASGG